MSKRKPYVPRKKLTAFIAIVHAMKRLTATEREQIIAAARALYLGKP